MQAACSGVTVHDLNVAFPDLSPGLHAHVPLTLQLSYPFLLILRLSPILIDDYELVVFDLIELSDESHQLFSFVFCHVALLLRDCQFDLEGLLVFHLLLNLLFEVPIDLEQLRVLLVYQVDVTVHFNLLLILVLCVKMQHLHVLPVSLCLQELILIAHPDLLYLAFEIAVFDPHLSSFGALLGDLFLQAYVLLLQLLHLLFEIPDVILILIRQNREVVVDRDRARPRHEFAIQVIFLQSIL